MTNERRGFLKTIGVGAATAGAVLAAPAARAAEPMVKWRLGSSFPKTLDTIYGGAEDIAAKLAEITNGRFIIEVNAAGVLAPAFGVLDAVSKGDFECAHTASYYYFDKDPTFALDCAIPFGMSSRMLTAFYYDGGGKKLYDDFFARKWGIVSLPAGQTGTQMGGWFKKEMKTLADLRGLKMRVGGFGGAVLKRLGSEPVQIPGAGIAAALESGKVDAAEWVGPYDDEKLGLHKVAPFYYYPGWWEGSTQLDLYLNKKAFDALSQEFRGALEAACAYAHIKMQAKYDARNGDALRRLIKGGTKMRAMPQPVMDAAFRVSQDLYSDLNRTNPEWAKIYPAYAKFQKESVAWFRYAENTYDNFVSRLLVR